MKYAKQDFVRTFKKIGQDAMGFVDFKPCRLYSTLEQSMADRDFPLTELECICIFKQVTGHWPSKAQLQIIAPDKDQATQDYRSEQAADYYSIYG